MSMVESTNAVTIETRQAGFGAWLRSFLIRLFGSAGLPSTTPAARTTDFDNDEAPANGQFVLAPGGYRIRVPNPSDDCHSIGNLLPGVLRRACLSSAASDGGFRTLA